MPAQRQACLDPYRRRGQAQLLQPGDLAVRGVDVRGIGQRGTVPQRQRFGRQLVPAQDGTGVQCRFGRGHQPFETQRVQLVGVDL
jgi:hypothetical protein